MSIAVPLSLIKNIESKVKELLFKIKSAASKINWLLNRGCTSSLKVVRKYPKAFRPYSCGMLVYKLVTPNVTISVSGSTSLGHLLKKSTLSRI